MDTEMGNVLDTELLFRIPKFDDFIIEHAAALTLVVSVVYASTLFCLYKARISVPSSVFIVSLPGLALQVAATGYLTWHMMTMSVSPVNLPFHLVHYLTSNAYSKFNWLPTILACVWLFGALRSAKKLSLIWGAIVNTAIFASYLGTISTVMRVQKFLSPT